MMSDPQLRGMPIAVLTTSRSEQSVCEICPPGKCLYFTKTDDFGRLQNIVRKIVAHAMASRS